MDTETFDMITSSPDETKDFGRELAGQLKQGQVVCLYGNLGSGKTCLAQGICMGLEVTEPVVSPSFTLVNEYQGTIPIYHFDLYRLKSSVELQNLGYDDYMYGQGLVLMEWPENAGQELPPDRLDVFINILSPQKRGFSIVPCGNFSLQGG
jgi:tRNA threonylcarbamoyladenosine biosynthesis protein TsaE